jgi:hypothetical protein
VIAPSTIKYDLPERARVARLFSQAADVRNREELHPLRLDLVRTLARLCKRTESPCRRQAKHDLSYTVGISSTEKLNISTCPDAQPMATVDAATEEYLGRYS